MRNVKAVPIREKGDNFPMLNDKQPNSNITATDNTVQLGVHAYDFLVPPTIALFYDVLLALVN